MRIVPLFKTQYVRRSISICRNQMAAIGRKLDVMNEPTWWADLDCAIKLQGRVPQTKTAIRVGHRKRAINWIDGSCSNAISKSQWRPAVLDS